MIPVDLANRFEERTDGLLTEEVWNSLSFIRRCTGSSDGAAVGPGVNTGRGNLVTELFCNAESPIENGTLTSSFSAWSVLTF